MRRPVLKDNVLGFPQLLVNSVQRCPHEKDLIHVKQLNVVTLSCNCRAIRHIIKPGLCKRRTFRLGFHAIGR